MTQHVSSRTAFRMTVVNFACISSNVNERRLVSLLILCRYNLIIYKLIDDAQRPQEIQSVYWPNDSPLMDNDHHLSRTGKDLTLVIRGKIFLNKSTFEVEFQVTTITIHKMESTVI